MKFTKKVHEEKKCIEYLTGYLGREACDYPANTIYELNSMSPEGNSSNLFVYLDNVRRYADKDFKILEGKKIQFNYKINDESNLKLTVTKKTE